LTLLKNLIGTCNIIYPFFPPLFLLFPSFFLSNELDFSLEIPGLNFDIPGSIIYYRPKKAVLIRCKDSFVLGTEFQIIGMNT
jgi:hypothetical protein